jgi:amino acid transporter
MATTDTTAGQRLAAELIPEQVLPKVLGTLGLTATYVFIICWISGASIMASGGWGSVPMWVLGFLVFLLPAGLAVAELGNLWPAQGGVYIWAHRTMSEGAAFFGGFLSWIPVILNGASSPAVILAFVMLALHVELGLTVSIVAQLVILWASVALALRRLAATQRVMYGVFFAYMLVAAAVLVVGITHAAGSGPATPVDLGVLTTPNFARDGWIFGLVLLYLVGVETPFNMGAEFLSVKRSATRMILWGSIALAGIYVAATVGALLAMPVDQINPVTGVTAALGAAGVPGLMEVGSLLVAVILMIAMTTYQSAYSRLIFVSGLERHLPRLFTHLNPRTRNPVTAILIQGAISSTMIVVLFSQANLTNVVLYLTGALSVVWLLSGFFFFIPLVLARHKYADRYASETFWRIPGGLPVVYLVALVGCAGTAAGIYYSFALPWSEDISRGEWMSWVGGLTGAVVLAAVAVYYFGRRSAAKVSTEDALAHLAVLEPLDGSLETP